LDVLVKIQRPLKKDKRNPMNMTTAVGKHGFRKGEGDEMFVGTYLLYAHPMSMITAVGNTYAEMETGED